LWWQMYKRNRHDAKSPFMVFSAHSECILST
jgi:hypothetical protein